MVLSVLIYHPGHHRHPHKFAQVYKDFDKNRYNH